MSQRTSMFAARAVALAIAALIASACAARSPVGAQRFHNRAPVWVVNDRTHVPDKPAQRRFLQALYHYDGHFYGRLDRWLQMRPERRAANVNALDEVPDSTWFTNRIGVRALTPEEIAVGPNVTGSPEDHKPWIVKSSKVGGVNVGFVIEDQRGIRYVLKFDKRGQPETETGADVVTQRLLWAAGYNVPEDYVVTLRREDLVLGEDAVIKSPSGGERPMTREFFEHQLSLVDQGEDGALRALASQFVPGEPIGGHPRDGVREDDPNDTIPHQLRRELRGQFPIFAWLGHTDIKEDNFLDTYVADSADPKVRYVVHYLIDFGGALGSQGSSGGRMYIGHSYKLDLRDMVLSLASFGLYRRPFEGRQRHLPDIKGVGMFDSASFDPGRFKTFTPSYFPLHDVDRFDGFWGAKIVARFTPAQIRAAVEQGRYSDPRAVDYLTRVLIERQRKTARYWFRKVNPIDRFSVEEDATGVRVCFDDLAILHRIEPDAARTRYRVEAFDYDGRPTGWRGGLPASSGGRSCVAGVRPSASRAGYTILRIETDRPGVNLPATLVHLARHPRTQRLRLIGLRRL